MNGGIGWRIGTFCRFPVVTFLGVVRKIGFLIFVWKTHADKLERGGLGNETLIR